MSIRQLPYSDFLEMEESLWLNERSQNFAKGRLST